LRTPTTAHAGLSSRCARVIYRDERTALTIAHQETSHIGNRAGPNTKIHKLSLPVEVGVSFKGGNLAPGNQQQAIEVRLQLAECVEVRDRVVIRNRHEVQPASACSLKRDKHGTRN